MRTLRTGLVAAVALGLLATACGSDDDKRATPSTTSSRQVVFSVNLTGAAEAPATGSTDGHGTARITVDPDGDQVCFELATSNVPNITGAEIRQGAAGTTGPVLVTLTTPRDGKSEGCVPASASVVSAIASGVRSFYLNVSTTDFPEGAVRAQLTG
jgi:CHRD domain